MGQVVYVMAIVVFLPNDHTERCSWLETRVSLSLNLTRSNVKFYCAPDTQPETPARALCNSCWDPLMIALRLREKKQRGQRPSARKRQIGGSSPASSLKLLTEKACSSTGRYMNLLVWSNKMS